MKESQQWTAAVQGTLPLELSKIINDLLDQKLEALGPKQMLTVTHPKIRKLRIDHVTPLNKSNEVFTQNNEPVVQQGNNLQRSTLKEHKIAKASKNLKTEGSSQSSKTLHTWRIYNRFGYIDVRICHQFIYHDVEQRHTQEMIAYSVRICPRYRWCNRAMYLYLHYDRTRGLSSPMSIQLHLPCIHPWSDSMVTALMSGCLETVQDLIRSGKYRPYDLIAYGKRGAQSLLNVSKSIVCSNTSPKSCLSNRCILDLFYYRHFDTQVS